jgi:hypothetical protein
VILTGSTAGVKGTAASPASCRPSTRIKLLREACDTLAASHAFSK